MSLQDNLSFPPEFHNKTYFKLNQSSNPKIRLFTHTHHKAPERQKTQALNLLKLSNHSYDL
ncbi:hypothetical protein BY996DRAFT_8400227 [Phakopsora pachyrhizi]|nr:hypothetical protein BY996DRAFT_8400227 [Phakopsora pachyrhizi]